MTSEDFLVRVREVLSREFGAGILRWEALDFPTVVVEKSVVPSVLKVLFDDAALQVRFLTDLCGVHFPDYSPPLLGVVYHVHSLVLNQRLRIKAFCCVSESRFPSVTEVYACANWMERETYDFYGIVFEGHPNLKRILNEDSMDYFPMRKEYKLEDGSRLDKEDVMFGRESVA